MSVSRLAHIRGIGVDRVGDAADAAHDPELLRLENLDTDLRPPAVALAATRAAVDDDSANSYLPFQGRWSLREAAASHVGRIVNRSYDPATECVSAAGGCNGILNVLFATVEPGQEVVVGDPFYAGLVNRVRLAGGVPRYVPSRPGPGGWTVDPAELAAAVGPNTAAALLMSPAMPSGALLGPAHWDALAATELPWLIYDAAMERIRFDGAAPAHPARHPGLADRTITVGSASKELRMIGWRVGWTVGPASIMADVHDVTVANVVGQVGIAQQAVAEALAAPDADAEVAGATATWQERAELIVDQLRDYPLVRPGGGWSLLVDTAAMGLAPGEAAARLFERGRVAATPMDGWGPSGDRYLRLVFSNEPVERLGDLRDRFAAAFGQG
jgi:aspartate/methionine/tyrosine aminotransferase